MKKSEENLVDWLQSRFSAVALKTVPPDRVAIGIGDDMAAIVPHGKCVLSSSDMLMDGVHFDAHTHPPEQIGRKALAVNLSDCAAMAVRPLGALVSVALPEDWSLDKIQRLFRGMEPLASEKGCPVIGGDTNSWGGPLVIDVTVLAEPFPDSSPVTRTGMRPGDSVYVSGRLGGSLAGHHLLFEPRLLEAQELARDLGADKLHAMIDLSDGLSTDAGRMAAASGCGIVFEASALETVISKAAEVTSKEDGRSPLSHALDDGEDFELLAAVAPAAPVPHEGLLWTRIGEAVEQPGVFVKSPQGAMTPMKPGGWQHLHE